MVRTDLDEWLGQRLDLPSGKHRDHAGYGFGSGGIDTHDARVRVGRANESQIAHLPQLDIVNELTFAAQQPAFLLASHRLTYPFLLVTVFSVATHVQIFGRGTSARYVSAACSESINLCTFLRASGSSSPPAIEVSRPKICASPLHFTLVPVGVGERSNPAVTLALPPATLPWPTYLA